MAPGNQNWLGSIFCGSFPGTPSSQKGYRFSSSAFPSKKSLLILVIIVPFGSEAKLSQDSHTIPTVLNISSFLKVKKPVSCPTTTGQKNGLVYGCEKYCTRMTGDYSFYWYINISRYHQ